MCLHLHVQHSENTRLFFLIIKPLVLHYRYGGGNMHTTLYKDFHQYTFRAHKSMETFFAS